MHHLAFVGCAHIHTPSFVDRLKARPTQFAVKYFWDAQPARAQAMCAQLGAGALAASLDEIWQDPAITSVVICAQTNHHRDLVVQAARARKHMFVEKPLGLTSADSFAMADAITRAGVKFQTGYFNRGAAIHRFIKNEITAGHLGALTRIRGSVCHSGSLGDWFQSKPQDPGHDWRWMADPAQAGCGAFGDLGTHALDLMMWLAGDVEKVTARIRPVIRQYGECDESGEALIQFRSGVVGTLAAGWVDVANPVSLLVSGTQGHATVFNGQLFYVSKLVPGADGKSPHPVSADLALPHAFDLFLDALLGNNVPLVDVHEAASRVAVMEAMYRASARGEWTMPAAPPD